MVYANINAGGGLSVLRSFRLLRVFKLATAWFAPYDFHSDEETYTISIS